MKKLLAILLCLCIMLSCASTAFAVTFPRSVQKTVTLSQDNIRYKFFDEDVNIKLTYTGYLGEISAKDWTFSKELSDYKFGDVSIPVLADGSEIIFEIVSKNPTAYYNFCYENNYKPVSDFGNFMDYPWDDCGGGGIWYGQDGSLVGEFPLFIFYKGNGTSRATAGPLEIENFGRKLAANKYSYKVQNGLVRYDFHATYPLDSEGRFYPQDIIASYRLTTALSVTSKQAEELGKTGLMSFTYKGYETITYQYSYQGLAKLLGIKVKDPLSFTIKESSYMLDNGYSYQYTLTNNTDAPIRKYSAFITYLPEMVKDYNGNPVFRGQIHAVDIDLAAGESVTNPIVSYFGSLSTYKVLWLDFDSLAEREQFLKDGVFGEISTDNIQGYRLIDGRTGGLWMAATLGVELESAK